MKKKLYVLDASGFLFRAYFALPPFTNAQGESTHALFGFIRSVLKLIKEHHPAHLVAVFEGKDNKEQRRAIYESYKAHRPTIAEDLPAQMDHARTFCDLFGIPRLELAGVEADDAMGSLVQLAKKEHAETYLCTADKDLAQLVDEETFLLNPWKEDLLIDAPKVKELFGVTPGQIPDLLALMGDTSDNIPGVKGIGPKGAVALLNEFGSLEGILSHLNEIKGKKRELLESQIEEARLSYKLALIPKDLPLEHDPTFYALHKGDRSALRAFYRQMDFHSLLRELGDEAQTSAIQKVETSEEWSKLVGKLHKSSEIALFPEATSTHPFQARLTRLSLYVEGSAFDLAVNPETLLSLKPLLESPSLAVCGHDCKLLSHLFANEGISIASFSFDTEIASYLLQPEGRHTLPELALSYGLSYSSSAETLFHLKELLLKQLEERHLAKLFFSLELPLSRVLAKMERSGIYVDVEVLKTMSRSLANEIQALEEEIYILAGGPFNVSSPKQLSHVLFEKLGIKPLKKTATGLSTNAEVLEKLATEHPIAQKLLEFRLLEKLRSTYVDALPEQVDPVTRRIHPTFSQTVTATGRLSCFDPNLQNIPVRSEQGRAIRTAFRPQKEGWVYLAGDYSQIELRLLAHLSQDPALLTTFQKGGDIHAETAARIFNLPLKEVTDVQRNSAKAINFGIIYGQQAYGLSQQLGISVKEALAFIEAYFEKYPKVFAYIKRSIEEATTLGYAETPSGRKRALPQLKSNNAFTRALGERLAMNTPLQGMAADLIKEAMLQIDRLLLEKNLQSFLILQVHDELIFEVPKEELPSVAPLVKETMESVYALSVPLLVDLKIGKNWGEC